MSRSRLCAALTLCGLFAFARSAAAECAWVLWQHVLVEAEESYTPILGASRDDASLCWRVLLRRQRPH